MRRHAAHDFRENGTKLQKHAGISRAVAATASTLVHVRRQRKSAKRRMAYQSKQVQQICFVLFVRTSPSATLALAYAEHARRQGKCVENISAEILQEQYLQTSVDDIANIMAGEKIHPRVLRAATRFEREQQLHEWIHLQNIQKGIAPSSDRILKEADRLEQDHEKVKSLQGCAGSEHGRTKWMQRFKRRWQIKTGTIQAGERIPQKEAKAKVPGSKKEAGVLLFDKLRTQSGPERRSIWRPQNWGQNKKLLKKGLPGNGPLFVPWLRSCAVFGQARIPK